MSYKKTKYYKLRREWKQYNTEYKEIKKTFNQIGIEFVNSISKFCTENDLGDPFKKTGPETQNVRGDLSTSSSKKLFRKIMVNTHYIIIIIIIVIICVGCVGCRVCFNYL